MPMKTIKTFTALKELVASRQQQYKIAVVKPDDEATKAAVKEIEACRLAQVISFNDDSPEEAVSKAVAMIRKGEADVLMKGLIGTDQLLRAVLNKETGLLPKGNVLTHIAAAEVPGFHKLLFFTDAAVIPYPTQEQREEQVRYIADTCRRMGITEPRIALLHCAEHGGKQFPFVDGYADIKQKALGGDFGRCIVDGPLDIKTAISAEALAAKHLTSPLEGDADALIVPDIEAGNILYKSITFFAHAQTAGMLCGTTAPVIVPSRGDTAEDKFNSILFALASL